MGAWLLGSPVALVLWTGAVVRYAYADPALLVRAADRALATKEGHRVVASGVRVVRPTPWPSTWTWQFDDVAILSDSPKLPTFFVADLTLSPPRLAWGEGGLEIHLPHAHAQHLTVYIDPIHKPPIPTLTEGWVDRLVVHDVQVDVVDTIVRPRRGNVRLVATAHHARTETLTYAFATRDLHAIVHTDGASMTVSSVTVDPIDRLEVEFTGQGMHATMRGDVTDHRGWAEIALEPMYRPMAVRVDAGIEGGTLGGVVEAILGPGRFPTDGALSVTGWLEAGEAMGDGALVGGAHIDASQTTLSGDHVTAAVVGAAKLAPFLRVDHGDVVLERIHGDVQFTEADVTFDAITYEAPHSIGTLEGFTNGEGISARLDFRPRQGHGAVRFGLIADGPLREPRVRLVLPPALGRWVPCEDPLDCDAIPARPHGHHR